jgi:hypothetical protein
VPVLSVVLEVVDRAEALLVRWPKAQVGSKLEERMVPDDKLCARCGKLAAMQCAACKAAFYCSRKVRGCCTLKKNSLIAVVLPTAPKERVGIAQNALQPNPKRPCYAGAITAATGCDGAERSCARNHQAAEEARIRCARQFHWGRTGGWRSRRGNAHSPRFTCPASTTVRNNTPPAPPVVPRRQRRCTRAGC